MIQRIQSLWLFLASMISGLLFMPSTVLYKWAVPALPIVQTETLTATKFYPLLIIAAFMTILPLVTIFFFKDRPRQRGLATLSILASLAFAIVMFMKITAIRSSGISKVGEQYGILGALVPVISIVFLILAVRGIRKDEKIIKSLDRLR
ncbi:MAG: DUF4293 family protein [Sphingobacteriales bacterium]|nr:MAG: DUF4293 family protein [Sphingobacteriales bacterium]